MGYTVKIKEEVAECFKSDPTLLDKTLTQIGEYFYLQGEIRHQALRMALEAKVEHYRKAISIKDFDEMVALDKLWVDNV